MISVALLSILIALFLRLWCNYGHLFNYFIFWFISNIFYGAKMTDTASKRQIGGNHYKTLKISPTEYIYANFLSWNLGNVIKYITRRKTGEIEDRVKDLLKAKHYIDLELQMVYGKDPNGNDIGPYTIETKLR